MIDSAASARDKVQKLLEKSQRKSNESDNSIDENGVNTHEVTNNIQDTTVSSSLTPIKSNNQEITQVSLNFH